MEKKTIKQLKKGDYFRLVDKEHAPLWVRGQFVRNDKLNRYSCFRYDDINHEKFFNGETEVFVEQ